MSAILQEFELDTEALIATFLAEAEENLVMMEDALLALERRPSDREPIDTVFRMAHSVKGNASCVGFQPVADFAHAVENLLEKMRGGAIVATTPLITTLLHATDALRALVRNTHEGQSELTQRERELLAMLDAIANGADAHEMQIAPVHEVLRDANGGRTLRVDAARLDAMLDLTGEIAIARGRLRQHLESMPRALEAFRDTERLFLDLQELVMRARMVPIGPYFRQQARVVRDLATAESKSAALAIEGADVEIDNNILEQLRQPLTHMLRNALHHGIESPEERRAAGKPAAGRVVLRATHEAGTIVIQIEDDGRGIDRDALLRRAIDAGVVAEGVKLDDREVLDLIFHAGVSTAHRVTEFAGRGVGMDVVRRNVENLRGSIHIASTRGRGTTVTLRLPLTLAIIDGFSVSVGSDCFMIPNEFVVECVALPDPDADTGVLRVDDRPLPWIRLGAFFQIDAPRARRQNVVVVECGGMRAGLAVDELQGQMQIVIKPMSRLFRDVEAISGSAILGDGRLALIVDVPALLQSVIERSDA